MPAFQVERSIRINAPESKVREAIEDFSQWPKWSPWLCMEPDAKLDYHGAPGQPGHGYHWSGDMTGAGRMEIVSNSGNRLEMNLEFLKPMKSTAKVEMQIQPVGSDQTDLTWKMDSRMPFFLFWMIGMIKVMIGRDYARGLEMLKEYVETGDVLSDVEIIGVVDVPEMHFVGIRADCAMNEIGDSMKQTLPAAHQLATVNGRDVDGAPGAIYHHVNLKQQRCQYSAIVPTNSPALVDETQAAGAHAVTIAPCQALKVRHTGSYENVANGWSTVMAYQRHKKHRPLKSQPPFELYLNDPSETDKANLLTEIYVPIRR